MHVLLAGATGVVGGRILPLLIARDHQVTALTRNPARAAPLRAAGADPVVADVYDRDALAEAVRDAAPDVVMHQLTDLRAGDFQANARLRRVGTGNLVDAALAAGVRRIIAQSISWIYIGGEDPADETTPLDLHAPQPRRRMVEAVVVLEAAARLVPEWMEALTWPSGAVNVCDDEPAPAREWVPVFCRSVGAPPAPEASAGARQPWARGADNHLARKQRGWVPRYPSWREGFLASVAAAP